MMLKENYDLSFMLLTFTFYDDCTLFMKFFSLKKLLKQKRNTVIQRCNTEEDDMRVGIGRHISWISLYWPVYTKPYLTRCELTFITRDISNDLQTNPRVFYRYLTCYNSKSITEFQYLTSI